MRKKLVMALAISAVLVLSLAGSAFGAGTFSLSASPSTVTWPHGSTLKVTFPTTPATATIYAMPVGASTWTTVSVGVMSRRMVFPRLTTAYKAVCNGVESNIATVAVAARLSKPELPAAFTHGRTVTVKGQMSPAEKDGVVTLQYYKLVTTVQGKGRYRKVVTTATAFGDPVQVALKYRNSALSTWSSKFTTVEKGYYKVVVSHQDDKHVLSRATAYFRVK